MPYDVLPIVLFVFSLPMRDGNSDYSLDEVSQAMVFSLPNEGWKHRSICRYQRRSRRF